MRSRAWLAWLAGLLWLALSVPALAQGLFWKIESAGSTAPSYLFGTIHTDDARVTTFPPAVALAIRSVDAFMLEALPPRDLSILMMPQGTLQDHLTPDELSELRRQADVHGLREDLAMGMKPWLLAVILAQPRTPSPFFQDMLLFSQASGYGKKILPLESAEDHFGVLDVLSMQHQLQLLRLVLAQPLAEKEQGFEQLLAAYLTGDAEQILRINEAISSRGLPPELWQAIRIALLEERNALMASRMQQAMQQGPVFVAVGAAHLAGEGGLLRRLQAMGYRLTVLR